MIHAVEWLGTCRSCIRSVGRRDAVGAALGQLDSVADDDKACPKPRYQCLKAHQERRLVANAQLLSLLMIDDYVTWTDLLLKCAKDSKVPGNTDVVGKSPVPIRARRGE